MARRIAHHKPAEPAAALAPAKKRPVGLLVAVALTLLLGGIPFALGKYIELNTPDPFDGGAYAYSAQRLVTGARLWVDESTSAQPGTLLCNVLGVTLFGFGDTGPNIIQMLLQIGGLAMLFYAVRRLFGNPAAVVSATLAAIMLSAPVVAKFGNVKEQFMLPFAIVAACAFALHETGGKKHWAVIAGAAAIIPYYFKPTGIAVVGAIGLYLAAKLILHRRQWKAVFLTLSLWVAGAILGLAFPASLFIWQGALFRFWRTFPVILLEGIVFFAAVAFAVVAIIHYIPWRSAAAALRTVPRKFWQRGALLIAAALLVSVAAITVTRGSLPTKDIPAYVRSLPFIKAPAKGIRLIVNRANVVLKASGILDETGYAGLSRKARPYADQAPQVFRYYHAVGAIVYPAAATLALLLILTLRRRLKKQTPDTPLHAIAALWAVWWLLDMALVWVSAHSYEQYYLPLCASGAALTAYAVWTWSRWLARSANKMPALAVAAAASLILVALVFPVFAGFAKSPDTGAEYKHYQTGQPERRRGFAQSLASVNAETLAPWQALGDYVRANSTPDETLYVWGWFPGIYVRAQRFAPVPRAYEGEMHVTPPPALARLVGALVEQMETNPPRFIADSLKRHFPFDRPPFELWPVVPQNMFNNPQPRLLSNDPREVEAFENSYAAMLAQRFGQDEALRFAAMKPFRDFVMTRYRLAKQFGSHMLFERKE